jgi:hypothetical protein
MAELMLSAIRRPGWHCGRDNRLDPKTGKSAVDTIPEVDFHRNMVVLTSLTGGLIDLTEPDRLRVNRVFERGDSVMIAIGPDSAQRRRGCCVDGWHFPVGVVVPRSEKPAFAYYVLAPSDPIVVHDWFRTRK